MKTQYEKDWESHWSKLRNNLFGKGASAYRKTVLGPTLSKYFEKYFPKSGTFVECGSGSSQTTLSVKKHKRKLIALDISAEALKLAKKIPQIDKVIKGDIFKLPFKANSVTGIWNLGVHEHFSPEDNHKIFLQYKKVLKKGGRMILFWPPKFSLNGMGFRSIEFFVNIGKKKKFRFFPDEINKPTAKSQVKTALEAVGFKVLRVDFPWRDLWGDFVVVAEKPKKSKIR